MIQPVLMFGADSTGAPIGTVGKGSSWCGHMQIVCAELHRKVVELQMSRAMFVLQHPAIASALESSEEAHSMITQVIAEAMFAGLDQVFFHEHGKSLFHPSREVERMQDDLQMLNLEVEHVSMPFSGSLHGLCMWGAVQVPCHFTDMMFCSRGVNLVLRRAES
jgi:hypothetical protein